MTLSEALNKLLEIDNYENLSNSQIYSILSDYGVFKDQPNLRIIVKTALDYGYWDLIKGNPNNQQISILKSKLNNDGFSESVANEVIDIINPSKQQSIENIKDIKRKHSEKFITTEIEQNLHICFMGLPLGVDCTTMKNWLIKKGFKDISQKQKRPTLIGTFLGIDNAEIVLWETLSKKIWSITVRINLKLDRVKLLLDNKYNLSKRECTMINPKYIYKVENGTINISRVPQIGLTRICYTDNLTYNLHNKEISEKNKKLGNIEEISDKEFLNRHLKDI